MQWPLLCAPGQPASSSEQTEEEESCERINEALATAASHVPLRVVKTLTGTGLPLLLLGSLRQEDWDLKKAWLT